MIQLFIIKFLHLTKKNTLSNSININLNKSFDLRYGENPHQDSSFYTDRDSSCWNQLSGKKLSYNNFFDMESSISIIKEFKVPCCCIIKHSNPCGFGTGNSLVESYKLAISSDPVS